MRTHIVLLFCVCGTAPETDKIRKIVHVSPLPDSIHLQNVRFTALVTPLVAFERPTALVGSVVNFPCRSRTVTTRRK